MEVFTSQKGVITKFVDTNLPPLKTSYATFLETLIRKISNSKNSSYFFQLVSKGTTTSIGSIEYSDLLNVIKALQQLKTEQTKDVASNPDYLENKYVTQDGFEIGYYVSEGKSTWYLILENYGTNNEVFIKDIADTETAFTNAKTKIEELQKVI